MRAGAFSAGLATTLAALGVVSSLLGGAYGQVGGRAGGAAQAAVTGSATGARSCRACSPRALAPVPLQIGDGLPIAVSLVAVLMGLNLLEVLPLRLPSLDVDVRGLGVPPAAQAYLAGAQGWGAAWHSSSVALPSPRQASPSSLCPALSCCLSNWCLRETTCRPDICAGGQPVQHPNSGHPAGVCEHHARPCDRCAGRVWHVMVVMNAGEGRAAIGCRATPTRCYSAPPPAGGALLFAYTLGYVSPLLAAALFTGALQRILAVRQWSAWLPTGSGVLLLAGGTYGLLTRLVPA